MEKTTHFANDRANKLVGELQNRLLFDMRQEDTISHDISAKHSFTKEHNSPNDGCQTRRRISQKQELPADGML